ncbi:MAG: hypothetical protein HYU30_05585 [Chloroflexi bacterium]|nr:hypothetical protein [Chloroflexota bacterium]
MNELNCPDCGKPFGSQPALSWHQGSVHGAGHDVRETTLEARKQGLPPEEEVRPVDQNAHDKLADAQGGQPTREEMRSELRGWGIGLIAIGVAQYFLPFLDPLWAFVVAPLGALSLFLAHRGLFIAIGATLVVVGLLNIFVGGFGGWTVYGAAQIYWGVQEVRKFGKYADVQKPKPSEAVRQPPAAGS